MKVLSRIGTLTRLQVLGVLFLLSSQIIWFVFCFRSPDTRLTDFRVYDVFAKAASVGLDPYGLETSDAQQIASARWGLNWQQLPVLQPSLFSNRLGLHYSPPFYVFFRPFAELPPLVGAMVWFFASCIAIDLSTLILSQWRSGQWVDPLTLLLVAVFAPVLQTLGGGQINAFVLLALTIALWGTQKNKAIVAGIGYALAILLRPLPAVIAVVALLLWKRQIRSLIWTMVWLIVVGGLAIPFMGIQSWGEYIFAIVSFGGQSLSNVYPEGVSIWTFVNRLFPDSTSTGLNLVVLIGITLLSAYAVIRGKSREPGLEVSVVLVGVLSISPITWFHYLVLLLIPLVFLLRGFSVSSTGWQVSPSQVLALSSVAFLDLHILTWRLFENQPLLSSWGTFALVVLFGALVWQLMQPRGNAAEVNPIQERQPIP